MSAAALFISGIIQSVNLYCGKVFRQRNGLPASAATAAEAAASRKAAEPA